MQYKLFIWYCWCSLKDVSRIGIMMIIILTKYLGLIRKMVLTIHRMLYRVYSLSRLQWSQTKKKRRKSGFFNRANQYWETQCYENWNNEQFRLRLRVIRKTFALTLNTVRPHITKQPKDFETTQCHWRTLSDSMNFVSFGPFRFV